MQEDEYLCIMKATIDIPDELYRRVKAKSALQGRPIRDVAIELFDDWVNESPRPDGDEPFVSVGELMSDLCGAIDSGVTDLSTNPAYLEDLGRASARDRAWA
jgi:hypothetical protein